VVLQLLNVYDAFPYGGDGSLLSVEGVKHLLRELRGDYGAPGVNRADGAREILGF
jgi:hypothetical protein